MQANLISLSYQTNTRRKGHWISCGLSANAVVWRKSLTSSAHAASKITGSLNLGPAGPRFMKS